MTSMATWPTDSLQLLACPMLDRAMPSLILLPSSHYYLRSLSRTSRAFYFPDSWDLLEVLGGLAWQRERPQGGSSRVREDPLGTPPLSLSLSLSLPRKSLRTSRRSRESRK